jgi:hypothetical protein
MNDAPVRGHSALARFGIRVLARADVRPPPIFPAALQPTGDW